MMVYEELIREMRALVLSTVEVNERKRDRLRNGLAMPEERFARFVNDEAWDMNITLEAMSTLDLKLA